MQVYPAKPQYIFFDVYDTLLNMNEVEKRMNNLLNSRRGYTIWFNLFMEYCFVDTCVTQFNSFTAIARATMQMAGTLLSREVNDEETDGVLELLKHLPLHDDVQEALSRLNDQGYKIAALTNSTEKIVTERMERTGLVSYFTRVMSAEHVKKYKPDLKVYQWAAEQLDAKTSDILMVSVHGWDIAGASNAGMRTAYIKRTERMHYPLAPAPDYTCKNLLELTDKLSF